MNLSEMRTLVRRDLHDEDAANYRWTNDEIERHISHTVKDFSEHLPLELRVLYATTAGSRDIDVSSITNRVVVEALEYPTGKYPPRYQPFAVWGDTITLLGDDVPDGSNARIYYGKLHTLDASLSTIPSQYEDLLALGACGYAAMEWAVFAVNRVNVGGSMTEREMLDWGKGKLEFFREEIERLGRRNRVRIRSLYKPYYPAVSKTTDYGPQR